MTSKQKHLLINYVNQKKLLCKENADVGCLWEARKIWSGIVNSSRSFAMMANDFITNEYAKEKFAEEQFFKIRKQLIMRHVAWMTALCYSFRVKKT